MKKTSKKKKKNIISNHHQSYKPSKALIENLEDLLELVPAGRLSKGLRKMFLLYLSYEKDVLPLDMEEFIIDLYFLFEFLDTAESEMKYDNL